MNSFQQATATRHEYRLRIAPKGLLLFFAVLLAAVGIFAAISIAAHPNGPASAIVFLFLLPFSAYMLAVVLRSRLVIEGTRIEVRGAFRERSADLSEIEGFRTISTRNGTYRKLYLKDGRGSITLSSSFATDDDFRAWSQQITDLDKRDRDALLDEISHDQELGATPEERLAALSTARTWSIFALVIAVAAAAALNFADAALQVPSAIVLALIPVALMLLLQRSPLLYAVVKQKSDPRAELSYALLVAGFGLVLHNRGIHFVSMQPLLPLIAAVAIVCAGLLYAAAPKGPQAFGRLIALLFFAGMYSYGLVLVADSLADQSPAIAYNVTVIGKHISHGRSNTYYLQLETWGPFAKPNQVAVSSSTYDATIPGSQVCLQLHPGRLHAPWFQTAPCTVQPVPEVQP
jgi:heme-degrading monooxygenase HmoA